MNPIKLTVQSTGSGHCALTGRECDGVSIVFENESPCFLSWKALRQIVSMKAGRTAKPSTTNSPVVGK
jgi:hypothetical protein